MAEPARKLNNDDQLNPGRRFGVIQGGGEATEGRGNLQAADSNPVAQSLNDNEKKFGVIQGGGEATEGRGNLQAVGDQESTPSHTVDMSRTVKQGSKILLKGRGALIGIGGILSLLVIVIMSLFSPFTLLHNIQLNGAQHNDARSSVLERRIVGLLEYKNGGGADGGACDMKKAKCRMGRVSNDMIRRLGNYGVVALDSSGNPIDPKNSTIDPDIGDYPDKNPSHWEIPDKNGKTKIISASEFTSEYKTNRLFSAAFKKAYNPRWLSQAGKHVARLFYNKFSIDRKGGIAADSDLNEKNVVKKVEPKLKSKTSDSDDGKKSMFIERIKKLLRASARKIENSGGDPIISIGSLACTGINMPRFIAGAYRAFQVAQILAVLSEVLMSPTGMNMAGDMKSEQSSAIGHLMTEQVIDEETGVKKSAMDSAVLLSAIGINSAKVPVNNYAPGFAILNNPIVKGSITGSSNTKEVCDLIYSPQAAIVSTSIQAAISVATAGIGAAVLAGLRTGAKLAIVMGAVEKTIEGFIKAAEKTGALAVIAQTALSLTTTILGNYADGARGVALGHILGYAIEANYAVQGLSTGGAVSTVDEALSMNTAMNELEDQYREEEIATLSPFDTSSKYTFLGSIVSNLSLNVNMSGNIAQAALSSMSYILSSPIKQISSPKASAASTRDKMVRNRCSYATLYGLPEHLCIGQSGYPLYVGINPMYVNSLSTEDVYNIVEADGDIDLDTGEIKEDGNIASILADCGDGDLEALAGCTIDSAEGSVFDIEVLTENIESGATFTDGAVGIDGGDLTEAALGRKPGEGNTETEIVTISTEKLGFTKEVRAARSLYMFDMVAEGFLNGSEYKEDEATTTGGTNASTILGDGECPSGTKNYGAQEGYQKGKPIPITTCGIPDWPTSIENSAGETILEVNSQIAQKTAEMAAELKAHSAANGNYQYKASIGFRTNYQQDCIYYNKTCSPFSTKAPKAAAPGYSNHQMGYSIDLVTSYTCTSPSIKTNIEANNWLNANMSRFGFTRDVGCSDYGHFTNKGGG